MNHIQFNEGGDENAKDHLIPLTPRNKIWIDHGSQSPSSSASIWNRLGRRLRRTIQKFESILPFDEGKDLRPPGHEVSFGQLDV